MLAPLSSFLLVGIGGALGAMARYGTSIAIGVMPGGFPLATLVINIAGSLGMGVLVGVLARTLPVHAEAIRLFVAVGIFGGFTTFSSFSLDAVTLIERGELLQAAIYVVGSVVLSVLALFVGLWLLRQGAA
jgi:CrcB protein